ncbi:LLM class flavin-dependent oxidoreductase [Rhodococcoides corynebacterioides]|uniref:LLM class flavin-dependent oxidoreductase n=1 Tax=Rhodococcoides corynebacterioides TaxID=53972 RepID=UPI000831D84F|nr:LLM class flavin-dependent oxidoreductase [Rhodococcus corynebacterioides]MBY6352372.1 LLM class flavin-dependent oxidoreductase [Rhodococcus corynebacterioides]MBY6365127.1 LLM class flavin-dependent oxidoreductase [Rhodococcus corynebacterioides]
MTAPSAPSLSAYAPWSAPGIADAAWWVALAASTGLDRVWFGQQSSVSVLGGIGYAAGRGHRVPVGSAVTLIPTTTPYAAALDLRALADLVGDRPGTPPVSAYFSPGYPEIHRALTGTPWTSPLTTTREFVAALRGLLAGGRVDVRGEHITTVIDSPAPDVRDRVEIGLGVLRPAMARLAGEIADGVVTWLATPDYLAETLVPALDEGAATAGRRRPRVVTTLHAGLDVPAAEATDLVRRAVGPHLRAPHYRDMLRRDGLDLTGTLDDRDIARVLDRGLVTIGDADRIASRAADLAEAGADEVSVVLHRPDGATRADIADAWRRTAAAVRTHTSADPRPERRSAA